MTRASVDSLLPALLLSEQGVHRHCAIVAHRMELGACALLLLDVAVHADAALDDLPALAEGRHLSLNGPGRWFGELGSAVRYWFTGMVSSPRACYRAICRQIQEGMDLATLLRDVALADGDEVLAAWCTLLVEQRRPMLARINARLSAEQNESALEPLAAE